MEYHKSVLTKEVLECLDPQKGEVVVDATFGFGGHSTAILDCIGKTGRIVGIEQDQDILQLAKQSLTDKRIMLVNDNFVNLPSILKEQGIGKVDKILFDLGISSYHFDKLGKGFSFEDEELDMRLDRSNGLTAADLVNTLPENELADLLYQLAGEYRSRRIARAITEARRTAKIESAKQLTAIIRGAIYQRGRINPATKTFQALRIAVNQELDVLKSILPAAINLLKKEGRICVISFHSLEDKIVKEELKKEFCQNKIEILTKKPIVADFEERKQNPRSRSAKLRAAKKII